MQDISGRKDSGPASDGQKPARILFVDHTSKLGGGELALLDLVVNLDRARFQPVVVLGAEGQLADKLRMRGVETHVLELAADLRDMRKESLHWAALLKTKEVILAIDYIRRLKDFMVCQRIDLVHTNSLKSDILGGLAARLAKKPLVWHIRDRITPEYLPAPAVKIFKLLSWVLPDFIIANSHSTLHCIRKRESVAARAIYTGIGARLRSRVIYEGIASSDNTLDESADPKQTAIGLVGRISPWKGQHVFIKAAAIVHERFPNAIFLVVGSALFGEQAYETEIKELASILGLDKCLRFVEFQDDVMAIMDELDILVHASTIGEPYGRVVVEAMSAGKPVVATRGGAIPELVIDGETGILVAMNDAEAMAQAIVFLLSNPEIANRMGEMGWHRAEDQFNLDIMITSLQEVYQQLLVPGSRTSKPG